MVLTCRYVRAEFSLLAPPSQMLMLLRRFPILNYLPINAIQGQSFAKDAIHVSRCIPVTVSLSPSREFH